MKIFFSLILTLLLSVTAQANQPDLRTLSSSGFIMGPGNNSYEVHKIWKEMTTLMKDIEAYDNIVTRMSDILCSQEQNKSVLLVGEPNDSYRYIFARVAQNIIESCSQMWHVDLNINKVEAGHKYVGEIERYWNDKVVRPSDGKNVVIYLSSLGHLIGLGSHSNDENGIEKVYAQNILAGQMRTVSFINKYEYRRVFTSPEAYVLDAFAEKINIPALGREDTLKLMNTYLRVFFPNIKMSQTVADYFYRNMEYFQPNLQEPQRSMTLLKSIVRDKGGFEVKTYKENVLTPNPYPANADLSFEIHRPDVSDLQLTFSYFQTERRYDQLKVYDANTNTLLDTFSGNLGGFITKIYPTNKLKMSFTSDNDTGKKGFSIKASKGRKYKEYHMTTMDVRSTLFKTLQIPEWMIDQDYSVLRDLRQKLDEKVVGVHEGKADMVKLAKRGYAAGKTDEKPIASSLLIGPTGTGKSYIAKQMAKIMGFKLITLDMTQYVDPASFDRFLKAMSDHLILNPYAMYLFEEIDKANYQILDRLYFMLDEGLFYDMNQRPLFARGAFVMMTTNAGKDIIIEEKDNPELRKLVNLELQKQFRPSFLNRFDAMSIFYPFTQAEFRELAVMMMDKKIERLEQYFGWKLTIDSGTIDYLAQHGQSELYGARPMERTIENVISNGIAEFQIEKQVIAWGDEIRISKIGGEHMFQIEVNNNKGSLRFEVDPRNNSGNFMNTELFGTEKIFR